MAEKSSASLPHDEHSFDEYVQNIQRTGISNEEVTRLYDLWAPTYDEDLDKYDSLYAGPRLGAQEIKGLFQENKDARILDIGAGTGPFGQIMREKGFTNIDAVDCSSGMLEIAQSKNVYKHIMKATLGKDKLDVPDNTYDGALGVAIFLAGHVGSDCFKELIRVVKPGGWIVMIIKPSDMVLVDREIYHYVADGRWKVLNKRLEEHYFKRHSGHVLHIQVL